jgi:hypothetical protein
MGQCPPEENVSENGSSRALSMRNEAVRRKGSKERKIKPLYDDKNSREENVIQFS